MLTAPAELPLSEVWTFCEKRSAKSKVLHVTDGKDPDEYIKKNGKQAFLKLVEMRSPYGDYKLESAKKGFDLSKDEDKIDYIKRPRI